MKQYVYDIVEPSEITSCDLSKTMEQEPGEWVCASASRVKDDGYIETNSQSIEVIFTPDANRAGVTWGADAVWTDADGIEDAIERYLGIDDKEMVS